MRLFLQNNAVVCACVRCVQTRMLRSVDRLSYASILHHHFNQVATFNTGKRGTQAILLLILLVLLLVGLLICAGLALIRGVVLGGSKG